MIHLAEASPSPYLKMALYGLAGSGKTWTAGKMLAQFIKARRPRSRLAMYDSEGGSGFIQRLITEISGKPLLSVRASSFGELADFLQLCAKEGYVGLVDSATIPWRNLLADFLAAKRARVASAGRVNPETVNLSLKDWGPIKEVWNARFSDPFRDLPADLCYCGRCGDVWEYVAADDGKLEMQAVGTKMKIESEAAYEPSLLIEMVRVPNPKYSPLDHPEQKQWLHRAEVVKDRADILTGKWADDPDYSFIAPHVDYIIGGQHSAPDPAAPATFAAGSGPSFETTQRRRAALLDQIKDELLLLFPGMTAEEKKGKVLALRAAFGEDASWAGMESETFKWTPEKLAAGLNVLRQQAATRAATPAAEPPKKGK